MRKNIRDVITAFQANKSKGRKGDSCSTDGNTIFSYTTRIAWRENSAICVMPYSDAPSATTRQQVSACMQAFGVKSTLSQKEREIAADKECAVLSRECDALRLRGDEGTPEFMLLLHRTRDAQRRRLVVCGLVSSVASST